MLNRSMFNCLGLRNLPGIGRLGAVAAAALLAVACGGSAPGGGSGTSTGGGTGGTSGTLALTLQLLDGTGASVNQLAGGQAASAQARLTLNGSPLANEIVTVSSGGGLVSLSPTSGAVLTDSDGVARVSVVAAVDVSGAAELSASATSGGQSASATLNYAVAQSGGTGALRIDSLSISAAAGGLSSYGTASISATVVEASGAPPAQPVTVSFSSSCPAGKATLTPTATTLPNGTVQATFTDAGCASSAPVDVSISASISTDTKSQVLRINPPAAGSLRFDSSDPADRSITLKGQGGVGRQEFATLAFRLVDVAGNGVPNVDVCFDATTYIGGLNIDGFNNVALPAIQGSTELCGSDNVVRYVKRTTADGSVRIQVNSGTTPTPVRVRARAIYPAVGGSRLETISDSLSISTGLPLQRSFDLSLSSSNIEGRNISGTTSTLTARLADQFGNPVPDGTVVNFIASGGAVCSSTSGSCTTANGECSCDFRSQEFRPSDGRVVVLAYTVGLEDYVDSNGNNVYDVGEPFTDLPDAILDVDKSGSYTDGTDVCLRFQNQSQCSPSGDGARGAAHLRRSAVILLSGSNSPLVIIPAAFNAGGFVSVPADNCPADSPVIPVNVPFQLDDGFGNATAASTGVAVSAESDLITAAVDPSSVPNLVLGLNPARDSLNAPKASTSLTDPTLIGTIHRLKLTPVASTAGTGTCATGTSGVLVKVTSPSGLEVNAGILFEGEPRSAARSVLVVKVE
jgi:hypothetical protein